MTDPIRGAGMMCAPPLGRALSRAGLWGHSGPRGVRVWGRSPTICIAPRRHPKGGIDARILEGVFTPYTVAGVKTCHFIRRVSRIEPHGSLCSPTDRYRGGGLLPWIFPQSNPQVPSRREKPPPQFFWRGPFSNSCVVASAGAGRIPALPGFA